MPQSYEMMLFTRNRPASFAGLALSNWQEGEPRLTKIGAKGVCPRGGERRGQSAMQLIWPPLIPAIFAGPMLFRGSMRHYHGEMFVDRPD